ncbi:hypothetical protein ACVWWZ_000066 [Thermostichus sp. OS-CIW-39]
MSSRQRYPKFRLAGAGDLSFGKQQVFGLRDPRLSRGPKHLQKKPEDVRDPKGLEDPIPLTSKDSVSLTQ